MEIFSSFNTWNLIKKWRFNELEKFFFLVAKWVLIPIRNFWSVWNGMEFLRTRILSKEWFKMIILSFNGKIVVVLSETPWKSSLKLLEIIYDKLNLRKLLIFAFQLNRLYKHHPFVFLINLTAHQKTISNILITKLFLTKCLPHLPFRDTQIQLKHEKKNKKFTRKITRNIYMVGTPLSQSNSLKEISLHISNLAIIIIMSIAKINLFRGIFYGVSLINICKKV